MITVTTQITCDRCTNTIRTMPKFSPQFEFILQSAIHAGWTKDEAGNHFCETCSPKASEDKLMPVNRHDRGWTKQEAA